MVRELNNFLGPVDKMEPLDETLHKKIYIPPLRDVIRVKIMAKLCKVKDANFDMEERVFHVRFYCEGGESVDIDLPYNEAENLKYALNDMSMKMHLYKTGGFVDEY